MENSKGSFPHSNTSIKTTIYPLTQFSLHSQITKCPKCKTGSISANSKALDISNCPLIKLAVNYSNYYGTYGIGFWYKPITNNQKNLTIKSNSFDLLPMR
jgi:hypothetical protein